MRPEERKRDHREKLVGALVHEGARRWSMTWPDVTCAGLILAMRADTDRGGRSSERSFVPDDYLVPVIAIQITALDGFR